MKQIVQLCAVLGCIAPWSLHASLVFQGVVDFKGSGLGSALTSLTVQNNGTESGCVAFIGGVDVIGSCDGASVTAEATFSKPITDYRDVVLVLGPTVTPLNLDSAVLTISANGKTFSSTGATGCPNNNCALPAASNGTGYAVHLDSASAAQALAALGPTQTSSSVQVALSTAPASAPSSTVAGDFKGQVSISDATPTFTGQVTVDPPGVDISAVPEPGTFALFSGAALLLIPLKTRRNRRA